MNLAKIAKVFQRLGFFKEYSALIVPIVLAVAAAALFVPTVLMGRRLSAQIYETSIQNDAKKIESYLKTVHSAQQWKEEERFQNAYRQDAERIQSLAEQSSQRQLLSYNIFPMPKDMSQLIFKKFGQNFRAAVESWEVKLNARDCPTSDEINKYLKKAATFSISSETSLSDKEKLIVDSLAKDIAAATAVYLNPSDIAGYKSWESYNYSELNRAVEDSWYWQIGYWIIEDVFKTVESLNKNSTNIFGSPLKRIISVGFIASTDSSTQTKGMPMPSLMKTDRPWYVTSLNGGITLPLTARVCNSDIDVVHFKLVVVVKAAAVMDFLQQLCSEKEHKFSGFAGNQPEQTFHHNQISILYCSFEAVDPASEQHELYRYGEDAVVKLDLLCEYILNKKGYDEIKPEFIKKAVK